MINVIPRRFSRRGRNKLPIDAVGGSSKPNVCPSGTNEGVVNADPGQCSHQGCTTKVLPGLAGDETNGVCARHAKGGVVYYYLQSRLFSNNNRKGVSKCREGVGLEMEDDRDMERKTDFLRPSPDHAETSPPRSSNRGTKRLSSASSGADASPSAGMKEELSVAHDTPPSEFRGGGVGRFESDAYTASTGTRSAMATKRLRAESGRVIKRETSPNGEHRETPLINGDMHSVLPFVG